MKKIIGTAVAGLALAASALVGAGSAYAQDNTTPIPGGDALEAHLFTTGGWSGSTSCKSLSSELTLWGTNPYYAQSLQNSTTIAAYGGVSTWLTWDGTSGSGVYQAHVSNQTTQGYDWKAYLDGGQVCIGQLTGGITGHLTGRALIPQQGGWYQANADLD